MTSLEQHVALIELHARLMDVLDAGPNGTVHPSHVGGVITDLLAYVIVDAAQEEHAETVTEEFTGMLLAERAPSVAYVERSQAYPAQGTSSIFSYGRATGAIETVITLCRIPFVLVEAGVWKRKLHLPGKDKEASRQKALQLFPAKHALLSRMKDHGRPKPRQS